MSSPARQDALPRFLLGTFTGTDHLPPSPWSQEATVPASATGSLSPAGVLLLEQVSGTSGGEFHALTVLMATAAGELLAYGFDTAGFPPDPPATGQVVDGGLGLVRRTDRGESRTTYRPTPEGFAWLKEFRAGPAEPWVTVVEGRLRRTGATAGT